MKLRTREQREKREKKIQIPLEIQNDINVKGFHLYKWISPDEVKLSIERDFLKVLQYLGAPLAIFACVFAFLSNLNIWVFLSTIFIGVFFIFIYLFFLSIKRSYLLSKSAFVVLTDSSISVGGKVEKLSDSIKLSEDIEEVANTFEEDLFGESSLSGSKNNLVKSVMNQLGSGYNAILKIGESNRYSRSRDSWQALLIIIGLYTAYIAIMGVVYFIGVLGLLLFGKLFTWLNTRYLILRGQNVIKINRHFGNIDTLSDNIGKEKTALKKHLENAKKGEWKDGLLLEINAGISKINKSVDLAVDEVKKLQHEIEKSPHKEMFSFPVYSKWIKKQISTPLEQIKDLLTQTKAALELSLAEVTDHISPDEKSEFVGALNLQEKRIRSQINDIDRFLPLLEHALANLSGSVNT